MYVNNLVVDPDAQGKGYGRVLMNCAEDWARAKACTEMALFTNVKMFENLGLYAKMGYDEVERRTEDGFDRVYFRKKL
jgi:GNAT superfamily N-acetyltransferase